MPLLQQLRHGSNTVTQLMTQQAKAVVVCSMHEEGQVTCEFPYSNKFPCNTTFPCSIGFLAALSLVTNSRLELAWLDCGSAA
jgi:hypothetical protein